MKKRYDKAIIQIHDDGEWINYTTYEDLTRIQAVRNMARLSKRSIGLIFRLILVDWSSGEIIIPFRYYHA